MVRGALNNSVTGVCYNHHARDEPEWRDACWGDNLRRLELVKTAVDPDGRFNCWHCVGYSGREVEQPVTAAGTEFARPWAL